MHKKKLRELRKLNATREMVEKAKSDKPTKGKRWWKYDGKRKINKYNF